MPSYLCPHTDPFGGAVFVLGLLARFFFQSCLGLADLLQPALVSRQLFGQLVGAWSQSAAKLARWSPTEAV